MNNNIYAITTEQMADILDLLIGHKDFRKIATLLNSLPLITGEPSLWVAETHSDQVEFFFDDPTEGLDEGVSVTAYYTHAQPLQPITAIMLDDDEWTNLWIECSDESASDTEIDLSLFAEKVQKAFCEKNGIKHRGDTK